MSKSFSATLFMLASTLSLSLTGVFAKFISTEISTQLHAFARFFIPAVLLVLPMIAGKIRLPEKALWRSFFIRGVCLAGSQICFIHAISVLSLVETVVLFGTGPLFIPLLEKLLFQVRIKAVTIVCLGLTFGGVLMLAGNPGSISLKPEVAFGLAAGLFNAGSQLSLYRASQYKVSAVSVNFWCFLVAAMLLFPVLMLYGMPAADIAVFAPGSESRWVIGGLFVMSLLIINTQMFRSKAYRLAESGSSLAPLIYTNLVFSLLWQWLLFDELLSPDKYLGLGLIVAAGVINTFYSRLKVWFIAVHNNHSSAT